MSHYEFVWVKSATVIDTFFLNIQKNESSGKVSHFEKWGMVVHPLTNNTSPEHLKNEKGKIYILMVFSCPACLS